jgi:hypothetical protein
MGKENRVSDRLPRWTLLSSIGIDCALRAHGTASKETRTQDNSAECTETVENHETIGNQIDHAHSVRHEWVGAVADQEIIQVCQCINIGKYVLFGTSSQGSVALTAVKMV